MDALRKIDAKAAWTVDGLTGRADWIFELDDDARGHLARAVKAAHDPTRSYFDYRPEDFDLGPAWPTLRRAIQEAHHGGGLALLRGLPRDGMSPEAFGLLNWAIGLHVGVARPQGKASQYLAEVRNIGANYRGASGRGYSSNARLDFHADSADLATLGCYNVAREGGQSLISSALTARNLLIDEAPSLAERAHGSFPYSRQNEEAPDEGPYCDQPIFGLADGRSFCKFNRNRIQSAVRNHDGAPPLTDDQNRVMDKLDEILRRPDVMHTMYLRPGDLQIMNNHVLLHSRTQFKDFAEPERRRLLFRLWLAPPDSVRLPESWRATYRTTIPGAVRGGIRGHNYGADRKMFDLRQARAHAMSTPTLADQMAAGER